MSSRPLDTIDVVELAAAVAATLAAHPGSNPQAMHITFPISLALLLGRPIGKPDAAATN